MIKGTYADKTGTIIEIEGSTAKKVIPMPETKE